jgi:diguanylate cyclase (GGDEF)-like protein/PAS domain S-box-containing protein
LPADIPSSASSQKDIQSVSIAQTAFAGRSACIVIVTADGTPCFETPSAAPLARALRTTTEPNLPLKNIIGLAQSSHEVAVGTVQLSDGQFERTFDITVTPLSSAEPDLGLGAVMISGHDVTLPTSMRRTLVESRQRYKDLVEISAAFAWETNAEGKLVFVSPQGVLGYSINDLIGQNPENFLAEPLNDENVLPFTARSPITDTEIWLRRGDGNPVCLLVSCVPLFDDNQEWLGARGVCRDITDIRERDIAIARARNRERLLSFIVRSFRDEVDPENMLGIATATVAQGVGVSGCSILRMPPIRLDETPAPVDKNSFSVSAAFGRMGDDEDLATIISKFLSGQDVIEITMGDWNILATVTRYRQAINGAIILWREQSRVPYDDDDRILLSDLSAQVGIAIEQISNHEHILALSRTDSLTGLFNRRAFIEEMDRRTQRLKHENRSAALIYVDLDNFKLVNDFYGHRRWDEALLEVKRLLLAATRPTDLVARLGGDEFALWMDGANEDVAVNKATHLLKTAIALDNYSASKEKQLTMSLGIAIYKPERPETLDALLLRADTAMYQGKHSGKGSYRVAPDADVKHDT